MFETLEKINARPEPFAVYTAEELWADAHTSEKMLAFHLNGEIDVSSRRIEFIDRSVEWIAKTFGVDKGAMVADFGCGPGLYALRLAGKGAAVTGIDFSPRSIQYARAAAQKEGVPVTYVNQNYLEFDTNDRFDLILMIMCDFCALGPGQRKKLLALFRRILAPGGKILFDVYSLGAFDKKAETVQYQVDLLDGFWSANKYHGFLHVFKYETEKAVLDKYTLIEAARTRTVYNWLQYFSPEALAEELSGAGFAVENFYSDVAGAPFDPGGDEFAVVAA